MFEDLGSGLKRQIGRHTCSSRRDPVKAVVRVKECRKVHLVTGVELS
jgi:hypothetical protein